MPCLDAKALENDPDGMAFLRSVLRPEAGEVLSGLASRKPATSPAMTASEGMSLPMQFRRSRRIRPNPPAPV